MPEQTTTKRSFQTIYLKNISRPNLFSKDLGDSLQGSSISKLGLANDERNELLEGSTILCICFVVCLNDRPHAHFFKMFWKNSMVYHIWLCLSEDKSRVL